MLSTVVFVAVFLGLLLASVALWAMFLRLGLGWAQVSEVTTRRVVLATAIVFVLQISIDVVFRSFTISSEAQSIFLGLVELVAVVVAPCAVIAAVFKAPFLRALKAWLPTLLATLASLMFSIFVIRPFLYESFTVPTNAMAPTLVGQHWKGICPKCGKPSYCTPRDEGYRTSDLPLMICDSFHVTEQSDFDKTVHSGDRFMVAKFLTPRRWDLAVFQFPEDPTTLYVKRLIGLPGEKIYIQDGSVWVDGKRQTPPESIQGIEYLSAIPESFRSDLWGSENRPALLRDDEYFVLGDFSAQSADSRFWKNGAPGHNPFAVPRSHMRGAVIHTYWPIQRWRNHR